MEIVTRSITRALRSCDNWNERMLDCTVKIKRDRKIDILGLQNRHVKIKRRFSFSQTITHVGQTQKPAKRQRSASVSCIMPSEVQNCIANFRALMSKYTAVPNTIQSYAYYAAYLYTISSPDNQNDESDDETISYQSSFHSVKKRKVSIPQMNAAASTINGLSDESDTFSRASVNIQTQGNVPEDSDNFPKECEPNSSTIDGLDDESDSFSEELANIQTQITVLEDSDSFSKELAGIFEHELTDQSNVAIEVTPKNDEMRNNSTVVEVDSNNNPATKDVDVRESDKIIVEIPNTSTVTKPSMVESEKSRGFQQALTGFQLPASMKIKGRRPSSQMDITMETIIELDTE